ncbi:hypothetical protein OOZ15_08910 [Galbibacter sp. EGI 63066]|uniref:hypothetical protein n=1 Tax=Galbibacter sp. EGI 63066 TaxID=2993559 RepID=UPI0022487E6C|nr:hypothetical protein [Galbibacter sp. EGI 63066]MCX2680055.1 hypothetical protein [Galbibacter sp. EGI 63066]
MKDKNATILEKHIFDEITKGIKEVSKTEKGEVYAYSLLIYDVLNDPINSSLTLGYNTIEHLGEVDDPDIKWEIAGWLKEGVVKIGTIDDSIGSELITNWIKEMGLFYTEEEAWEHEEACWNKAEEISLRFMQMLIRIIQKIHQQYRLNVPLVMYQFETFEGVTAYNIQANGKELVKEFLDTHKEYEFELYRHMSDVLMEVQENLPKEESKDIYAYSLFIQDDDPRWPTATLGYNTWGHFNTKKESANTQQEAKWNFDFWLQNNLVELCTKNDRNGREIVEKHTKYDDLYYTDEEYNKNKAVCLEKGDKITQFFTRKLIEAVRLVQDFNFIDHPIIIHKAKYDRQTAEQNTKANGEGKVKEFVEWVEGKYR